MEHIFKNQGYLIIAALAVSAPIIIHLINRLRFKRIRWAAMEFLLKAQKKSRKRLILEQLLLLLLRCLLVGLIGFLVVRFMGFGEAAKEFSRKTVHYVLIDDSLSMRDTHHKRGKSCFDYAKELLIEKVAKQLRKPNADELILVEASRLSQSKGYDPVTYSQLNDGANFLELENAVAGLRPTNLHVNLAQSAKDVHELMKKHTETQVVLHVLSDFRNSDWGDKNGEALHKIIQEMVDVDNVKVQLLDASDWQGFPYPKANTNVAIIDFQPEVKVAGKGMPVGFTVEVRNFSAEPANVHLKIFDGVSGKENLEANFYPSQPMQIAPKANAKIRFEMRFYPQISDDKAHLVPLVAMLKNLQHDDADRKEGIDVDNIRFAAIEIRNQVPILILDGEAGTGKDDRDLDSFHLTHAVESTTGQTYLAVRADKITGGQAVKVLERSDLHRYPVILMTNIRELNQKQLDNLEKYVRNGGGVGFFMGPLVSPKYYNEKLYADGKGIFPAPLRPEYTPPSNEEPRPSEFSNFPQLLVRQDLFPDEDSFPIFGKIDPRSFAAFNHFPVYRYFKIDTGNWKKEKGQLFELATLPNDDPIGKVQGAALALTKDARIQKLLEKPEYAKYAPGVEKYWTRIRKVVEPGSPKKAQHLSFELDQLLNDKGSGKKDDPLNPDLAEFWNSNDSLVASIKEELIAFRNELRYGDPLVLGRRYGSGRVVATMTSSGKVWQDFAGGSASTFLYEPFIYEMINFLSSSTGENSLNVGAPVRIAIEKEPFVGKQLKLEHTFSALEEEREEGKDLVLKEIKKPDIDPEETEQHLRFFVDKNLTPGQSVLNVTDDADSFKKSPLWYWYVFNVDSVKEGNLERVNPLDIDEKLIGPDRKKSIAFIQSYSGRGVDQSILEKKGDYSESPYLYLIILLVLVLEQAMAVHLSYHLRGSEQESLGRLTKPSAVPDQVQA